jgi:hypothetical protein
MIISTATTEQLQEYKNFLEAELAQEPTPIDLWSAGVSPADYAAAREYMQRRLLAVEDALARM